MFDFILIGLALRFLVFDSNYSPIPQLLQKATHPILVSLAHCSFCQGCEIGFLLQVVDLYHGANIASVFLKAIAVGYASFVVGLWLDSLSRDESFDFDDSEEELTVDED